MQYLIELNPENKLLIIWGRASYDKYRELKEYLGQVNQGLELKEYWINFALLAANVPEKIPLQIFGDKLRTAGENLGIN